MRQSSLLGFVAALVVGFSATQSHATCYGGGYPITLRPSASVTGQFAFQIPSSPTTSGSQHWLLVDDYDEDSQGYPEDSGHIRSGFINTNNGTTKTELLTVIASDYIVSSGLEFASCTIKAFMMSNSVSTPAEAYLVVKSGATQSDGSLITVSGEFLVEYDRVMTTNPITSAAWTSDDLLAGVNIGIKNTAGATNGVGYGSIALTCQ